MQEYDFKDDNKKPSLLDQFDMILGLRNEDQDHLYGRNQDEKKIVHEDSTGQDLFQQKAECQKALCSEDLGKQLISFMAGKQDLADNMGDQNKNNKGPTKSQHQQHDYRGVFCEVDLRLKKNKNYPKHLMKHVINRYPALGKQFFMGHQELYKEMNTFVQEEQKMYKEKKNWNNNLQSMKKIFGLNEKSKNPMLRSQLTRKMTHHLILQEVIPKLKQNRQIKKFQKSYLFISKIQLLRCRNADLMCRVENH